MHIRFTSESFTLSYREGVIETEHIFENHSHPSYELIAIFDGEISIVIGNSRYELRRGELAIIPPLSYHSVFVHGNVAYKRATVLFGTDFIPREIEADFREKIIKFPTAKNEELAAPMVALSEAILTAPIERNAPLIGALITQLFYICTYKESAAQAERSHPTVRAITEYIDLHIEEKISLDGIAQALFVSKSTVCHLFRDEMKIPVKQYILQKKLSYAAKLIAEGERATEVSRLIGYDNYANFYRLYKKLFGTSPTSAERKK